MLQLNLPTYQLRLEKKEDKLMVFDPVRKKFLVLTPEEWVRQHFMQFLMQDKKIPLSLFSVEGGLDFGGMAKRTDILVYNKEIRPFLLVECKASHIQLNEKVRSQVIAYISDHSIRWLCLTNGITHLVFKRDLTGKFFPAAEIPMYNSPEWHENFTI
jgi:hypothetical protein